MSLRSFIQRTQLLLDRTLHESRKVMRAGDAATRGALDVTVLEERILMSASPMAALAECPETVEAPSADTDSTVAAEEQVFTEQPAPATDPAADSVQSLAGTVQDVTTEQTLELVFIDGSVSNIDQLIADLQAEDALDDSRQLDFVVLDTQSDGIAQITEALLGYNGVDGIHIVSHGTGGSVQLGSTVLSLDNLDTYLAAINAWQHSLSPDADLLFYGCNLAATEDGRELLNQLAATCDCDVSASDDLTGHASLGGNWELEFQIGAVESELAFSDALTENWTSVLDVTTGLVVHNTFDVDGSDSSGNSRDAALTNGASIDTTSSTNIIGDGKVSLDGIDDFVDLSLHAATFQGLTEGTISAWFYADALDPAGQTIFSATDSNDALSFLDISTSGDELIVGLYENGSAVLDFSTTSLDLQVGQWYHVAVTVDGSGNQLYVNGIQQTVTYSTGTAATQAFFSDVNDIDSVLWGASRDDIGTFSFLDGFIDEGRVYDRALSSNDVLGLYNEQFGPITVDTANDLVDGTTTDVASLLANRGSDGLISLREAILAVNNDSSTAWSIELAAGTFNLASGSGDSLGDFNIRNDVTIVGAGIGSTIIDGNLTGRLFEVVGANVTFENLTLQEGGGGFDQGGAIAIDAASDVTVNHARFFGNALSFTDGGAIHNQGTLTVNSSFFDSNQAASGGAILNTGTLAVTDTSFDGNVANNASGGAIHSTGSVTVAESRFNSNGASNSNGGAIYTTGVLAIAESTFDSNVAVNGSGGAIHQTSTSVGSVSGSLFAGNAASATGGALLTDGTLNITNTTFSGNQTSNNTDGSSILVSGAATLQNVTVTGGTGHNLGAVHVDPAGTLDIGNTIIAGNAGAFGDDLSNSGTINDLGNNLIGDGSGQAALVDGVNGNQVGTSGSPIDPLLDALADNGGPTLTHALLAGSSAIDAGNNSGAPTTDQRAVTRDSSVDIGAFEFNATSTAAPDDLVATATRDGGLNINRDGGNDVFLSVEDSSFFAGSQVTIEFQISDLQNTGTSSTLFSNVTGAGSADFKILSDGRLSFIGFNTTSTSTQLFDGNDHSVAFSFDGGTGEIRYYVDGQFVESVATPMGTLAGGDFIFGQDQDTLGGVYDANETFSGSFRDIRVFSDIRTDAEISASYRSSLPFDEAGLVANWRFDGLSTENVLFASVTGNQLTVEHINQSGFTGSSAEFDFRVDENAVDGTVIGTITGIDQEREALIASLLAADPQLVYSAATGKFYKAVLTPSDFAAASSAALSTQLNSVNGQLVTIRSAAEQAIIADIAATANASFWLGATDTSNEGEFRWQEAGQDADLFWSGGSGGYNVDGAYTNWPNAIQPDNFGGDQDGLRILANGVWDDVQLTDASLNYIVEWNADDVLDVSQALNYSIESQSVAGAFEIDADNGQLRVADGALLDADTLAAHTVTVRVTDNSGQFRDEIFTVSLNNLIEDNNAPTDLSSGIELNLDGGNDAYLLADDGGALLGGLTSVTLEATFSLDSLNSGQSTILNYFAGGDAVSLRVSSSGNLGLEINNQNFDVTVPGGLVLGESYSFAATWDNNGNASIYLNGELLESSTGFQTGYSVATGGELVLGQDQDSLLGGFGTNDTFSGVLYDVRIWDEVRSASEISLNYQHKFDGGSLPTGLIANWQFDGFDGSNQVVDVVSGNNLSIGHAAGAGFTTSTPVDDLNISENATNGESVGFVLPSDPDSPQDVVDDGLFLAESPGRYAQGQSIGQWTVLSGDVDLAGDSETPGGGQYLELSGLTPGSIGQTLTTEAGRQYQVVFAFSGQFDGGEITKDLRVSADGSSQDFSVIEPAGWTASDFVWDTRSFTFTAEDSSTELSFASLDNSDFGPVIADVRVIEIPQAVTTILNNDPGLAYDAATDKFYRVVTATTDAATATSNAGADSINGVGGQLVTIRSQYENDFIYSLIQPHSGLEFYTGGTDATVEGQWNWIDDGVEADRFWDGNGATGSSPSGAYSNFGNLGDPDGGTAENHLAIRASDGAWLDTNGGATSAYIVEWDASEVLSNFTFELTNDAGGRFAIDANTGEITVADGSQIDFETAASHDVTVEVTDASGNSYSENITIAVSDVNESPSVVTNAGAAVVEGQSVTLTSANLQVNDADAGDGPSEITFTIANVQNGQLELTSAPGVAVTSFTQAQVNSGEVIFQHDDSETSTASFEFSAADGGEDGATAATGTFNLSVTGVNDAPTTTSVTLTSIAEDSGTRVITQAELLANASDVEGDSLTAIGLTISSGGGSLVDNGDGTFSYTPAVNDDTDVSFNYAITDGTDSVIGSATLDITPVNDAPTTITPIVLSSIVEDSGTRVITQAELLANANDVDGDALTATGLTITSGSGTLVDNGDGTFSYTLAANDDTDVSFSYTVSDGTDNVAGSATLNITPVNDEEVLVRNAGATVAEGSSGNVITAALLETADVDNSNSELIYVVNSVTNNGTLRLNGSALSNGQSFTQADIDAGNLTYDHDGSQTSTDSFDFTVDDGAGTTIASTFNFTIANVNDAPVNTVPGAQAVNEDEVLTITGISVADADGSLSTVQLTVNNGVLNVSLAGSTSISAGTNGSSALTLSGSLADINLTLASLTYQGDFNFNGSDTLTVLSTDSDAATDSDTVPITVNAVNDVPVVSAIANQVIAEDTGTGPIAFTIGDAESAATSLVVTAISSDQTLIPDANITLSGSGANRVISVQPAGNQFGGPSTITVSVDDGTSVTQTTFDVTVSPVNDAPVNTVPGTLTVVEETATAISGLSVADVDAAAGVITTRLQVTSGVLNLTLSGGAVVTAGANNSADLTLSGTVTELNDTLATLLYTPNTDITGVAADTLIVTTDDGGNFGGTALQDTDSVQIDIINVNDEETLTVNSGLIVEEGDTGTPITRSLLETTDVDNPPDQLVYTLTSVPNPTTGLLRLSGAVLSTGQTFTQADINAGLLTYDHTGAELFADSFSFTVNDGTGSQTADTFAISVNPVNDQAPAINSDGAGANAFLSIAENTTAVTTVTAVDNDLPTQALTFAVVGGADQARFNIDAASGTLTFAVAPDFETPVDANADSIYEVVVEARDEFGLTDQQTIVVTVTDVDEFDVTLPVDTDATANQIAENIAFGTDVGITVFAEDLDGTTSEVTYSLDDDAGGLFTIDSSTGVVTTRAAIDFESTGSSLDVIARATSADGSTAVRSFDISVNDVDEFDVTAIVDNDPAADVIDENVTIGTRVGIAALSQDFDGSTNAITYSLDDDAGGLFAIDSSTGVITTRAVIDFESTGSSLNIIARATSADGSTAVRSFDISVNDVDEFDVTAIVDNDPSADVIDENVTIGTRVGIAALSQDFDGSTNAITYSLDDDAGGLLTIDSSTGIVTTNAVIDFESTGSSLNIIARATSADGSTAVRSFDITINDVDEFDVTPVVDNDAAANQIDENVAAGTAIGITAFSQDFDATTSAITYSLDDDAGGLFAIDSSTGVVTTNAAIDFESTGGSLDVVARASSADGSTTAQSFAITINDVDEFDVTPIVDNDAAANQIDENVRVGTAVGITAFSQDPDGTTNAIAYSLDDDAGGLFTIASSTGVVTTNAAIDFETVGGSLNIVARATSADGSTTTRDFTITVNDLNDNPPEIVAGQSFAISELASTGASVGFVAATDVDSVGTLSGWTIVSGNSDGIFTIDAVTGEVIVADTTQLNHELTPTYTLTLSVSDGVSTSDPQTVLITVSDENDAPVVSPASFSVMENSASGTVVGTVLAGDEDAGDTLAYAIAGPVGQPFAIDSITGVLTVVDATQLDFEVTTAFVVDIAVTDSNSLTTTQAITITLNNQNESPFDLMLAGGIVAENSAVGSFVATVAGTDPDVSDVLTYTLLDSAGGRFAVDSATGEITVANSSLLNFEAATSHQITVQTTDFGGLTHNESFTVTVTNVNEAPVAADDQFSATQLIELTVPVGLVTFNDFDVDGDMITVILVDAPLNGTVQLNVDGSFTYLSEGSFSGSDSFTYRVSDGFLTSNVATVEITVLIPMSNTGDNTSGETTNTPPAPVQDPESSKPSSSIDPVSETNSNESEELATQNAPPVSQVSSADDEGDLTGFIPFTTSQDVVRETRNNEFLVTIFLNAVPEGEILDNDRRQTRYDDLRANASVSIEREFLFSRIVSANPLFTGSTFEESPAEFVQQREEGVFQELLLEKIVVGSTAAVSTSVSVGYVVWMLRGGSLLTTFMSSLPAWQTFDPLPVLESFDDEEEEEGESLVSIVNAGVDT